MRKTIVIEITEDGEFVWGGHMNSEYFTQLLDLADKLSDKHVEETTSQETGNE